MIIKLCGHIEALPQCCGMSELGGFYDGLREYDDDISINSNLSIEEMDKSFTEHVQKYVKGASDISEAGNSHAIIANVVDSTPNGWKEYFKASKMCIEVANFTNAKTDNLITTYLCIIAIPCDYEQE